MPIRPENVDRYPPEWPQIRARILQRAGNCCERCGVRNHILGGRDSDGAFIPAVPEENLLKLRWPEPGTFSACAPADGRPWMKLRIIRIVLTIAHLDHVVENCGDDNLQALCQRCHLVYDAEHHAQTRYRTQREGRAIDMFPTEDVH